MKRVNETLNLRNRKINKKLKSSFGEFLLDVQ